MRAMYKTQIDAQLMKENAIGSKLLNGQSQASNTVLHKLMDTFCLDKTIGLDT